MIDTDIRTYLLTQASITAVVGSAGVYVEHAQQGIAPPYCVVTQESGNPEQHAGGVSGLSKAMVDIACFGATVVQAGQLAALVSTAMAAKQTTMGTVDVRSSIVIDERRETNTPQQGDQTGFPAATVTAEVFYQ